MIFGISVSSMSGGRGSLRPRDRGPKFNLIFMGLSQPQTVFSTNDETAVQGSVWTYERGKNII